MRAPFLRTDSGAHHSIDFEALCATFPDLKLEARHIASPSALIAWQQLRQQHGLDRFPQVPCDVFVWAKGDAPDRRLTRVGGVPFLPTRMSWPEIRGRAATFLCQFDFRDSADLVGKLPGDLLLVFVDDVEETPMTGDIEGMHFEWVSADERDIIAPSDVPPPTGLPFITAWGVRYRTFDLPGALSAAEELDPEGCNYCHLPVLFGTKIGGVPHHSQEFLDEVPADYLCQLVSIQGSFSKWPFCDREEPLGEVSGTYEMHADENCLMIGDLGELTIYLRADGTIETESACG